MQGCAKRAVRPGSAGREVQVEDHRRTFEDLDQLTARFEVQRQFVRVRAARRELDLAFDAVSRVGDLDRAANRAADPERVGADRDILDLDVEVDFTVVGAPAGVAAAGRVDAEVVEVLADLAVRRGALSGA